VKESLDEIEPPEDVELLAELVELVNEVLEVDGCVVKL